jgi:membrane protein involved in colicin uptake
VPITENTAKHDVTPVAKPGEAHETAAQEAQKKLAAEATAAAKAKAEAEAAAKAKAQADAIAKAKAEAEAKAKGDAKPEAPKDGKSTGWLDMIESSASKAAGAIWDSATSVLPVLNLIHSDSTNRAVEKKEDVSLTSKNWFRTPVAVTPAR